MVAPELQALHNLSDCEVLIRIGYYLRSATDPAETVVTDNEMSLMLTILHLLCRSMAINWQMRQADQHSRSGTDEESPLPYCQKYETSEPDTAA